MRVSFIIPVYNGLALTQAMLTSLRESLPSGLEHEIIFVDDGSMDGTRDWLNSLPSPCRAVLNEKNLGFAGTCNRGASAATGEYLFFLNNDLLLAPGWLEPMLAAHVRLGRKAGLTGNLQYRVDDDQLDHAGIIVSTKAKLEHVRDIPKGRAPSNVFAVTAACCLVTREVFLGAGSFDENYFNGAEDVDLALRLRTTGRRIIVVPGSSVKHHVSATRGPTSLRDEANSRRLFIRWPKEIEQACATSWALTPKNEADGFWRARLIDRLYGLGWWPGPSLRARLLAQSAVWREHVRWRKLFEPANDCPLPDGNYESEGFKFDGDSLNAWLLDEATINIPAGFPERNLFLSGRLTPPTPELPDTMGELGLRVTINGLQTHYFWPIPDGHFNLGIDAPATLPKQPLVCKIRLLGVDRTNRLGLIGRLTAKWPMPRAWRDQLGIHRLRRLNRRMRVIRVVADEQTVFDFVGQVQPAPLIRLKNQTGGLNITGWFRAELGLGESARCMARAADAAHLPVALVDLRLNCLSRQEDNSFTSRLQTDNPHPVNVFHIDPPVARDIDHHHGGAFRHNKYNIAYWAWELPEFPDRWAAQADYFDEIWCPSEFVRAAIAAKVRIPVRTMPHAISVQPRPGNGRERFGLPEGRRLFLSLYDLNSFQERKNPLGALAAYRRAFPNEEGVSLIIKTQNKERHPAAYEQLQAAVAEYRQVKIIAETLDRSDITMLEASCDAFISLHRSEGFGLVVAECMALGRPVISTDWSATAEFVTADNGCPVRSTLVKLEQTHGPYDADQTWAEPDIDHAVWWLRRLQTEPGLVEKIGQAGQETITRRFSPKVIGNLYRERLAALGLRLG